MSVTIFIPAALRSDVEGLRKVEISAEKLTTLGEVLNELARRYPRIDRRIRDEQGEARRFINIFINQDESRVLSGMSTPIPPEAEIRILPSVAGG